MLITVVCESVLLWSPLLIKVRILKANGGSSGQSEGSSGSGWLKEARFEQEVRSPMEALSSSGCWLAGAPFVAFSQRSLAVTDRWRVTLALFVWSEKQRAGRRPETEKAYRVRRDVCMSQTSHGLTGAAAN